MITEENEFIFTENSNAAYKKPTSQSGVVKDSSLATDGSRFNSPTETCSLTSSEKDPWWRVDMEKEVLVRDVYIFIFSPVDYVLEIRIGNHDEPNLKENSLCGESFRFRGEAWRRIRCPVPLLGIFVTITRLVDNGNLMLCEVEIRQEGELMINGNLKFLADKETVQEQQIKELYNLEWRLFAKFWHQISRLAD